MFKVILSIITILIVIPVLLGCKAVDEGKDYINKDPDIVQVRNVLKTAMPLSYAANATMAAMNGASLPGVSIVETGDTSSLGCFLVHIDVGNDYPFPSGVNANGNIIVAGFSVDNEVAIMTALFTSLNVTEGVFTIQELSTFPVVQHEGPMTGKKELMVVYSDIDVNFGSNSNDTLLTVRISQDHIDAEFTKYQNMKDNFDRAVEVHENAWLIKVEDQDTPGSVSDDRYVIFGGGQYIEGLYAKAEGSEASITQLCMIDVLMTAGCNKNPIDGYAGLQNLDVSTGNTIPVDLGHILLTYHPRCDGNAEATVATGVYTMSFGDDIALNLGQ
jgi:hypothetical protein